MQHGLACFLLIGAASLTHAASVLDATGTNAPATNAPPATATAAAPSSASAAGSASIAYLLRDAFILLGKDQTDAALEKTNEAIKTSPQSIEAYLLRGSIYSKEKKWDESQKDFEKALEINPNQSTAKFNLSELKFMQKQYDAARPGFLALEKDSNLGDLATYKVFLCDLFGGHEDDASKELDSFNKVGSNPSYYFANAAWSLFHHNTEDARSWLKSAVQIYAPNKANIYASSLKDLGYLPLPNPPST